MFGYVLPNRCSYKFCKIHKKAPMSYSLFNKVASLYSATLLKEKTPIQVFSDEFCNFLQNTSR